MLIHDVVSIIVEGPDPEGMPSAQPMPMASVYEPTAEDHASQNVDLKGEIERLKKLLAAKDEMITRLKVLLIGMVCLRGIHLPHVHLCSRPNRPAVPPRKSSRKPTTRTRRRRSPLRCFSASSLRFVAASSYHLLIFITVSSCVGFARDRQGEER